MDRSYIKIYGKCFYRCRLLLAHQVQALDGLPDIENWNIEQLYSDLCSISPTQVECIKEGWETIRHVMEQAKEERQHSRHLANALRGIKGKSNKSKEMQGFLP